MINVDEYAETVREIYSPWFLLTAVVVTSLLFARAFDPIQTTIDIPDWVIYCADGNLAEIQHLDQSRQHLRFNISRDVSTHTWDLAMMKHIAILRGERYSISFEGRAADKRKITCSIRQFHPPWNGLGLYQEIDLDTEWQRFRFEFVATSGTENGVVDFQAGLASIPFELRDFQMEPTENGDEKTRRDGAAAKSSLLRKDPSSL